MLLGMLQHLGVALGMAQAVGPIAGVPLAAGLAAEIVKSCEEVMKQKGIAKALGQKSTQLANALQDAEGLEGMELQGRIDETTDVLRKVLKVAQRWQRRGAFMRWLRRADMEKDLEQCNNNLDNAIKVFELKGQIAIQKEQQDARVVEISHFEANRELLLNVLQNQQELQKVVQLHQAGRPEARELMESGQKMLKEMRLEVSDQGQGTSNGRYQPFTPPTSSSPTPNKQLAVQQYRDMQRGLALLHRMTAVLPPDKVLDGTVKKVDDFPVVGGSSSDIWRGVWLEEEKVALKSLRNIKVDDAGAQKRFVREIDVWSKLSNTHILQFYGIVTDLGANIFMVSPWLENGDVLDYLKKHSDANKLALIRGAAEGMKYLHSENVIHGNLKCANILVSASGEACISDFGMAKVIEDVTKTPASTTLASSGGTRWVAPEIIEGSDEGSAPSRESDTYSFGMAVLELLTGKPPFPELKSDAAVIRALMIGAQPKRPEGPVPWLDNKMWALMQRCWLKEPRSRPTMEAVITELREM